MGEFSERVFEILAAHSELEKSKGQGFPKRLGRSLGKKPRHIKDHKVTFKGDDAVHIENFKNALFRLVMLRARSELIRRRNNGEETGEHCLVQISLILKDKDLNHKDKFLDPDDIGMYDIIPTVLGEAAVDIYSKDTQELIAAFQSGDLPLACA